MQACKQWIVKKTGCGEEIGSKALLLRYGEGGENYAHEDHSGDFQALLMLSKPEFDYTGGAFYLADRSPPNAVAEFPFGNAGDLIIFCGNQGNGDVEYLHGITKVTAGSAGAAKTRRFAVGGFQ